MRLLTPFWGTKLIKVDSASGGSTVAPNLLSGREQILTYHQVKDGQTSELRQRWEKRGMANVQVSLGAHRNAFSKKEANEPGNVFLGGKPSYYVSGVSVAAYGNVVERRHTVVQDGSFDGDGGDEEVARLRENLRELASHDGITHIASITPMGLAVADDRA